MPQQSVKDWVVRAVAPKGKAAPDGKTVQYFLVGTNDPASAKQRVKNWLKAQNQADWDVEDPALPILNVG